MVKLSKFEKAITAALLVSFSFFLKYFLGLLALFCRTGQER